MTLQTKKRRPTARLCDQTLEFCVQRIVVQTMMEFKVHGERLKEKSVITEKFSVKTEIFQLDIFPFGLCIDGGGVDHEYLSLFLRKMSAGICYGSYKLGLKNAVDSEFEEQISSQLLCKFEGEDDNGKMFADYRHGCTQFIPRRSIDAYIGSDGYCVFNVTVNILDKFLDMDNLTCNLKMLLVEDSAMQRKIISRRLQTQSSWEIKDATNGEDAIALVAESVTSKSKGFDLIIVDETLSTGNSNLQGHQVVELLRRKYNQESAVIIGCTGNVELHGEKLIASGCDAGEWDCVVLSIFNKCMVGCRFCFFFFALLLSSSPSPFCENTVWPKPLPPDQELQEYIMSCLYRRSQYVRGPSVTFGNAQARQSCLMGFYPYLRDKMPWFLEPDVVLVGAQGCRFPANKFLFTSLSDVVAEQAEREHRNLPRAVADSEANSVDAGGLVDVVSRETEQVTVGTSDSAGQMLERGDGDGQVANKASPRKRGLPQVDWGSIGDVDNMIVPTPPKRSSAYWDSKSDGGDGKGRPLSPMDEFASDFAGDSSDSALSVSPTTCSSSGNSGRGSPTIMADRDGILELHLPDVPADVLYELIRFSYTGMCR